MEANLFIKSYKREGNKITDIQFYGDWEIETGGSGEITSKYVETRPLNGDLFPFGITLEREDEEVSGGTKHYYKIINNSPWKYYISINAATQKFTLPPNNTLTVTQQTTGSTISTVLTARIFSEDKKHCVGIIQLTRTV